MVEDRDVQEVHAGEHGGERDEVPEVRCRRRQHGDADRRDEHRRSRDEIGPAQRRDERQREVHSAPHAPARQNSGTSSAASSHCGPNSTRRISCGNNAANP
jgi:hypothetical protein